jgi:hypothetical protein
MKAIINGKRYDTEKATEIASASSDVGRSDYGWWSEALYKTPRSGAFFIAGSGHARSHYAENLGGGSWGPGSKITPLTKGEAMEWCERNSAHDALETHFGDMIEDA